MFALIDIVLLFVTLFLGYKIFTVLGKRTGHEKDRQSQVIDMELRTSTESIESCAKTHSRHRPEILAGLQKIRAHDRQFDGESFVKGANAAFEMILTAFLKGDKVSLRKLMSKKMFIEFEALIKSREAQKQTADLMFFRLITTSILETKMTRTKAKITLSFKSEQTLLVRDSENKIIEGDADFVDSVTDIWVFEKPLNSRDPNWMLVEIQDSEEY